MASAAPCWPGNAGAILPSGRATHRPAHLLHGTVEAGGEGIDQRRLRQLRQRGAAQHGLHHGGRVVLQAAEQRGARGGGGLAAGRGRNNRVQPLHGLRRGGSSAGAAAMAGVSAAAPGRLQLQADIVSS